MKHDDVIASLEYYLAIHLRGLLYSAGADGTGFNSPAYQHARNLDLAIDMIRRLKELDAQS